MADKFDIGVRVKVKPTYSKYPGERGMIIRMGLGKANEATEIDKNSIYWMVDFAGEQEEIPEIEMELLDEV
jgi:hypothetical protein